MANILIRDLSPELEASLHEYAKPRGLSLSQAAVELMELGMWGLVMAKCTLSMEPLEL